MTTSSRSKDWREYAERMRPLLEARADGLCEMCGEALDFDAPARSRRAPSIDHVVPVHAGGDEFPPLDELRLVHYGCNARRGNRTRARARAAGVPVVRPAVELVDELEVPRGVAYDVAPSSPRTRSRRPSLSGQTSLLGELELDDLLAPSRFLNATLTRRQSESPPPPGIPRNGADFVELVAPRLETPRPSDVVGSYGAEAAGWIREYLGSELRPWQRYALERILERRADGSLRWRRVIVTVSRQSGKSVLARGICGWRVGAADVFAEPQEVLHVANIRSTARRIWQDAARSLERTAGARIRHANGSEALELADGSAWRLAASNLDGGVGSSVSLAFVDEAWRVSREVVDGSIAPTMLERRSPQMILVSTAGDGGSTLLLEDREAAIAELDEPDRARILLLEWSAPPDADPNELDSWRLASPHWTPQRREALAHAHATTPETEWRRQYLNQWVQAARSWVAPAQWQAITDTALELPGSPAGTLAINDRDGAPGACGYVLAVDAGEPAGVLVTGRAFASRRAMWQALDELTRSRRGLTVLYPASFAEHVAKLRGVDVVKVGTAEQRAGYGPTLAAIADGRLTHDGDGELTRQILTATPITIPDQGTTLSAKRSPGPIYLARAAVWAIGYELRPDRRRKPMIVGG